MFLVGMISWWYGSGWQAQFARVRDRIMATADFFSIGQLVSTLFSPFRQISAQKVSGPLADLARAFFDQLISRVIGAIIRSFTILFGIILIVLQSVYEVVILLFWLLLPVFPIAGLILMALGWVPRWM